MPFIRPAAVLIALAASSAAAQTADPLYTFAYTGFNVGFTDMNGTVPPHWDPNATLKGSFSGWDWNRNGILERSELSKFNLEYVGDVLNCASPYWTCYVNEFRYSPEGGLHIRSTVRASDPEGFIVAVHYLDTSNAYVSGRESDPRLSYRSTWTFTPQTTLVVTPDDPVEVPPVPEPAAWQSLGAGLLLLGALAVRRQRRSSGHPAGAADTLEQDGATATGGALPAYCAPVNALHC